MDQEWALSRRVGGPSMDQGRSSTVSEKWEGGWRVEGGFYHGLPLRHAASAEAKGHCNVTILLQPLSQVHEVTIKSLKTSLY